MAVEKPKSRGGRPRGAPIKDGEKIQIGVRVTPRLRKLLEKSCAANGRSLTQEAEARLERSFERQDVLKQLLEVGYGRQIAGLVMLVANTARLTGMVAHTAKGANDKDVLFDPTPMSMCLSDPWVFAEIQRAISIVIQSVKPAGDDQPTPEVKKTMEAKGWSALGAEAGTVMAALLRARRLGDDNWVVDNLQDLIFSEGAPR